MEFIDDEPIQTIQDDKLNRGDFSSRIATYLLNTRKKDNMVIAINGKWGSGKSSILNMVKENIIQKRESQEGTVVPFIIDFSPWNVLSQDKMIDQFFNVILKSFKCEVLKKGAISIGNVVFKGVEAINYVLKYTPLPSFTVSMIKKVFDKLYDSFKQYKETIEKKAGDIEFKKKLVEDNLKESPFRYIVFIDDIDRLNNTEIRLVFQLIKAVCGFSNITYVLAYDKEIVSDALKNEQSLGDLNSGYKYLEKIVQVEFNVPNIKQEKILEIVEFDLNVLLGEKMSKISTPRLMRFIYNGMFTNYSTVREEKRFMNSLSFVIGAYKEIDVTDLIGITYLRVLDNRIISLINSYKDYILGKTLSNRESKTLQEKKKAFFDELKQTRYTEVKEDYLLDLFPNMFTDNLNRISSDYLDCRISRKEIFEIYMNMDLSSSDISVDRLKSILSRDDMQELVSYSLSLSESQGRSFFVALMSYSQTVETQDKASFILMYLFNNLSKINFAEQLILSGKDHYFYSICSNIFNNIDYELANEIIIKNVNKFNDVYAMMKFISYFEPEKGYKITAINKIKEPTLEKMRAIAYELVCKEIDSNLSHIYDSEFVINYYISKEPKRVKEIISKKNDDYLVEFINRIMFHGKVESSNGSYYRYWFSIEKLNLVFEISEDKIIELLKTTTEEKNKFSLVVLLMQLKNIPNNNHDMQGYIINDINKFCDDNQINISFNGDYIN